ncbi:aquaporin-like protein [Massarina eburnea CBS 473.64]|uniref:Aquaporin-like protein n=1 Tax=Massarina eburnea CBS 473.64 TaxID=1395130 RepID=A0A6A6RQW5_9PLEO|nr:aquaporin-like protein [Massarina eburnea CBS 473.64]
MSANEEEKEPSGQSGQEGSAPQTGRTKTSTLRPPSLQHQQSSRSSKHVRPNQETQPSYRLDRIDTEDQRSLQPSARENKRAQGNANVLLRQHTEKKPDENFYVDNDYFDLNPWYDQQPKKPVFGLGKPFPRTVRPGMLWGRKGEKPTAHNVEGQHKDHQRSMPTLHIPLNEKGDHPPEVFEAEIGGLQYEVRRIRPHEGEGDDEHPAAGIGREDHAPGTELEDSISQSQSEAHPQLRQRFASGYPGGLPPVEETDSVKSFETSETDRGKDEMRKYEEKQLQEFYNRHRNPLARFRAKNAAALAEFLCTTVYVFFGIAGSLYSEIYPAASGDYQTQAWAWGIAVMAGIYVGGGISGAHMSPWISVSVSAFRGFPWKQCFVYVIAQILAGFAAGALAWAVYREAIMHADPDLTPEKTGIAFYSIPQTYVSTSTAFFNNFVSAAFYLCVTFAIQDDDNTPPGSGMNALIYGLLSYLLSISMGYYGIGISPARDLGPRFIAWWVGYGRDTFATGWWAYGPVFAGLSGSLFGALVYDVFIFTGGESPVNYHWQNPREMFKWRYRTRKEQAKEHARKLEPA